MEYRRSRGVSYPALTTSLRPRKEYAIRRLLSDLEECLAEPLPGVAALPLDKVRHLLVVVS